MRPHHFTTAALVLTLAAPVGVWGVAQADPSTAVPATPAATASPATTYTWGGTPAPHLPDSSRPADAPATREVTPTTSAMTPQQTAPPAPSQPVRSPAGVTARIAVGPHVANVPGLARLGEPLAEETVWASAGGGYAQRFENGWALIKSSGAGGGTIGTGGVVTGVLLGYFESNGYVNVAGWPDGVAVSDQYGTYQRFSSSNGSLSGAIMNGAGGTYVLKGAMYGYYFASGLRTILGSPRAQETRWAASGGGWAQRFDLGHLTYQSTTAQGYVLDALGLFPEISRVGWPVSGTYTQCGGLKVRTQRGYVAQNDRWCPSTAYEQPKTSLPDETPLNLAHLYNGVKVKLVKQAFGVYGWEQLSSGDIATVKTFQSRHGLRADGIVGPLTYDAIKTAYPNSVASRNRFTFAVDALKAQPQVGLPASRAAHIDAMIAYAVAQQGASYTWGGTGGKGLGYDCSGLVLQALRAGGVDPAGLGNWADVLPASDLADRLYQAKMQKIPVAQRQRGDLVFWHDARGKQRHVGIYLGNNTVYETASDARPAGSYTWSGGSHWGWNASAHAVRPFTTIG